MGNDNPPKLLEGYEFLQWKREIEMWALATSLDAKKQGPAVRTEVVSVNVIWIYKKKLQLISK